MINTITTALLALGFAALCPTPKAFGVVPPPDGGYAGGNTAEGTNALLSRTSGIYNTGIGIYSLLSLTGGSFNTGVGAGTLLSNTADENTATGAGALLSNVTGTDNTANGSFALFFNTATGNTAIGSHALLNNTTGGTLENIQGTDVGPNVAVGEHALESNIVASANTAVGYQALQSFTGAMGSEQIGLCTAVGFQALGNATGGFADDGFGYQALANNTIGAYNTAIGLQALFNNTIGSQNTAVGQNTLFHNTDGSSNIALGYGAGSGVSIATNVISIGAEGADVNYSCYIGNIFGAASPGGIGVFVNSDGKLGTTVSSRRFKDGIKPMDKASAAILALKPVTFRYKKEFDPTGIAQFGLVAEEVEKVNPDLVVRDQEGKPYSVRYDQVNAMLLNEFLKEHRKVQEEEATITQLESKVTKQEWVIAQQRKDFEATLNELRIEMETIAARLKDQDAKIQKVSTQMEMSKPAPRVTSINP